VSNWAEKQSVACDRGRDEQRICSCVRRKVQVDELITATSEQDIDLCNSPPFALLIDLLGAGSDKEALLESIVIDVRKDERATSPW